MKRRIYKALKEWKFETNRRPLLIRGARQIGKSYIVDVVLPLLLWVKV